MSKSMGGKPLGRGLEALMGMNVDAPASQDAASQENQGILRLAVGLIEGNPNQPRREFAEEPLRELADSIRENGIIQPILVEKTEHGRYMIVAGERRYRAAKLAGLAEVPVIVRSFTDQERLEIALIENIQREDLNPMEEARAYRHLMETFSSSQEEVAQKVGKQRSTVANALRLLKLPEDMQESLEKKELTSGHARAVLSVGNSADQRLLFGKIKANGLSVREAEALAAELNKGIRPSGTETPGAADKSRAPELLQMEQKFMDALGTKINLKGNGKKGTLEIAYYSTDDLSRLFEVMTQGKSLFDQ